MPKPQNLVLTDPKTGQEKHVVLAPIITAKCHHTPQPDTLITLTDPTTGQKEEISIAPLRKFCPICGRYYR